MKSKELVTLRQKPMKNGGTSLFLDYVIEGVRHKEYLKMYIVPEKTRIDKIQNAHTLKTAQAMKAKRIVELQDGKAHIKTTSEKSMTLLDYIRRREEIYINGGHKPYSKTLHNIIVWIERFNGRVTLRGVTNEYLLGLYRYMLNNGLSENSACVYFDNLNSVLNHAYRDGLIEENPVWRMDKTLRPSHPEVIREYLTLDEVRILMRTPAKMECVKNAFLFSCFTGLRISDVENLTWAKIKPTSDGGWQVEARQKKTKNIVVVPLSENALNYLPERRAPSDNVWELPKRDTISNVIKSWVASSGIQKKITFHTARHTNATLLLTYGADIYTVMSLLGHRRVSTTEIYAKIVNEKKVTAVMNIPRI